MRTELTWIEGPWPGRLAIAPRPRGGDWLEDEISSWRQAGIEVVVSLLTQDEADELDILMEQSLCRAKGIAYISFPITDRGIPSSHQATLNLVKHLEAVLAEGKTIAIHCRAGIGRSALLAASLLVSSGADPETAFRSIAAARGCPVPDTPEQREWVITFAQDLSTMSAEADVSP
jgi:protein-tyrosine phosphatase